MKQLFQILVLVLCGFCGFAATDTNAVYWSNAQKSYQAKQYDAAIDYYTKMLPGQSTNARIYYNLGNAYYRSNQVGEAVLNYERALFYDPQIKNAKDNLILAKSRIPNAIRENKDIFFLQWRDQLTAGNQAQTWAIISLLIFLLFLGLIFLSLTKKSSFRIPAQTFIFIPLLILLCLFCAFQSTKNATVTTKAVVMGNTAAMTTAPGIYNARVIVPEATTVTTGLKKGTWIKVTLPDNRSGWMQQSELTFVQHNLKK